MKKKNFKYRLNNEIRNDYVRIVGDGIKSDVVPIKTALKIASDKKLDLVEISPNADPPVCKVVDFNKFLYSKKQKEKENKKKQKKTKTKEIRLTYNTGEHDLEFKLKHAIKFLTNGDNLKITMWFTGREIQFIDMGKLLLLKFIDKLKDYGKVENLPKLDNKRLYVNIKSIKKQ
jgi:translation initiation factor IF-3